MPVSDTDYTMVDAGQTAVADAASPIPALAASGLDDGIAITCFNPASKTIGIARLTDKPRVFAWLESIITASPAGESPVCEVRLIGGAQATESAQVVEIIEMLQAADKGRNVLNLVSCAVGESTYPTTFRITALDGKIKAV